MTLNYQLNWIKKNPFEFMLKFIIITIVVYYLWSFLLSNNNNNNNKRIKPVDGKNVADLVLLYAPWCGHSKNMMEDYDRVISDYHGKKINGYTMNILKYNSDIDKNEIKKRNVKGFPTLFLEKNGESIPFNKRKYNEIIDELNNLL
tara:strand:- start:611 stop:1048 length:438 start_codon:yes stop_codon:yes gene_type:complete